MPALSPAELIGAALAQPWANLAIAGVIAVALVTLLPADRGVTASRPGGGDAVSRRYSPERRAIGWSAGAVIVIVLAEHLVRGHAMNLPDAVSWWRYATPLSASFLGLAFALVMLATRGSSAPEKPVIGARRTWLTFAPRRGLVGATFAAAVLAATALIAGSMSSPDQRGRFAVLEVPIPNADDVDPLRVRFFGWAYGVPVLVCLTALAVITAWMLHAVAARPFLRPETVPAERSARRRTAAAALRLATAGALLGLAGAWRFIGAAGSTAQLTVQGQGPARSYEVIWHGAEIASALGWLAPAIEITGFVLLLLVLREARREASAPAVAPVQTSAVAS